MSLREKITEDLKTAMKTGDKAGVETLRMLRAQIIEFDKKGLAREMNADDEMSILLAAIKKRKEAIELYQKAGRRELADAETHELNIINRYLPQQVTRENAEAMIQKIISETGAVSAKDLSKVMPLAMKELKGKIDGKIINEIVKQKLSMP